MHYIIFYQICADFGTKNAVFTGTNGNALGGQFTAQNMPWAATVIDVGGVVTDKIKLTAIDTYDTPGQGGVWGASQIVIIATYVNQWQQPVWTGPTNSHGTVSATHQWGPHSPWNAFDGNAQAHPDFAAMTAFGTELTLQLNYNIKVYYIIFYQICADFGTKNAKFTGTNGIALGGQFTAQNTPWAATVIDVGGVVTSKITLNALSTYDTPGQGGVWGASQIVIIAEKV